MDDDYTKQALVALEAQAKAAHALARLLRLADTRSSGQIRHVARFIAALYNGNAYPLDLFDLRAVDVDISDDVLACIDALRWGRADLYKLVPDGAARIERVIKDWGVAPPDPPLPPDGADMSARLVSCGDAPGYRGVTLVLDCEPASRPVSAADPLRLRLSMDAESTESIGEHIAELLRFAWAPGRRPLDAGPEARAPRWLMSSQPQAPGPACLGVSAAVSRLVVLITRWDRIGRSGVASGTDADLREQIRAIGHAADALGGFEAMAELDRAVRETGVDTSSLNELWDGIGHWQA